MSKKEPEVNSEKEAPNTLKEDENEEKKTFSSKVSYAFKNSKIASFTAMPVMGAVGGGAKQSLGVLGTGVNFLSENSKVLFSAGLVLAGVAAFGAIAAPTATALAPAIMLGKIYGAGACAKYLWDNKSNVAGAIINTNKSSHKFNQNLRERVPGKPVLNNLAAGVGYALGAVASLVPVVNGMTRGAMNQFNESFDRHPPLSKEEKEEKKKQKKAKKNKGPEGDGQKQKQKPSNDRKPGAKPKVKGQDSDGQKAKVAPKDGPASKPESMDGSELPKDKKPYWSRSAPKAVKRAGKAKKADAKRAAKADKARAEEARKLAEGYLATENTARSAPESFGGGVLKGDKPDAHTLGGSVVARTEYTKTDAGQAPKRRGFTPSKGMRR